MLLVEDRAESDLGLPIILTRPKGRAERNRKERFNRRTLAVRKLLMNVGYDGRLELADALIIAIINSLKADADTRLGFHIRNEVEGKSSADPEISNIRPRTDEGERVVQLGQALGIPKVRGDPTPIRHNRLGLDAEGVLAMIDEVRHIKDPRLGRGSDEEEKG